MIEIKDGKLLEELSPENMVDELRSTGIPEERMSDQLLLSLKSRIENEISSNQFAIMYKDKCIGIEFEYEKSLLNGYEIEELEIKFMRESSILIENRGMTYQFYITMTLYKSDEFNAQPFLDAINALEESDIPERDYLSDSTFRNILSDEQNKLIDDVESMGDSYIIQRGGTVDYEAKSKLYDIGIVITPGETDSFGWLSGCIYTKKGIVVFG